MGKYNVFHDFYRELVQALYDTGALSLRVLRQRRCDHCGIAARVCSGKITSLAALSEKDLETAAFNVFLYGRMIGAAAEIDDHVNRGRNMDTRTAQEKCSFVV